jgi:hypothetical protein
MLRCSAVIRAYSHHVACEWLLYFTKSLICFFVQDHESLDVQIVDQSSAAGLWLSMAMLVALWEI